MTILHIVPHTSLETLDAAVAIAQGLRDSHNFESQFYSFLPVSGDKTRTRGFEIITRDDETQNSLTGLIADGISRIVFHVDNTTYTSKDIPGGIQSVIDELSLRLGTDAAKMVTVFHSIPTSNAKPSFLPNPFQERITEQIADLSGAIVTNNTFFEKYLLHRTQTKTICINNFSHVGELQSNNLLGASRCNLIVLGGAQRISLYQKKGLLKQVSETLKAEKIVDIGPPIPWSKLNVDDLKIEKLSSLKRSEISDQLTISRVGLLDYSHQPECLGKSSIFNAYKAHGVAPLTLGRMHSDDDNIIAGTNYFTDKDIDVLRSERTISRMARVNHASYQTHNKAQWINLISELLT